MKTPNRSCSGPGSGLRSTTPAATPRAVRFWVEVALSAMTRSLLCFLVVGCRQEAAVAGADGCANEHGVAHEEPVGLERTRSSCQYGSYPPPQADPAASPGPPSHRPASRAPRRRLSSLDLDPPSVAPPVDRDRGGNRETGRQ